MRLIIQIKLLSLHFSIDGKIISKSQQMINLFAVFVYRKVYFLFCYTKRCDDQISVGYCSFKNKLNKTYKIQTYSKNRF